MTIHLVTSETIDQAIEACLNPEEGLLGFDSETKSLNVDPQGPNLVVSLQFAPNDADAYVFPVGFTDSTVNLDDARLRAGLQKIWDTCYARKFKLVAANVMFDLDATHGYHQRWWPRDCIADPLIRAWLSDPVNRARVGFGLKARVQHHLGIKMLLFREVTPTARVKCSHPRLEGVRPKTVTEFRFQDVDIRSGKALQYAAEDATLARRLYKTIELTPQQAQLERVELATVENVRRMRDAAVYVDLACVQRMHSESLERFNTLQAQLREVYHRLVPEGSCLEARAIATLLAPQFEWMCATRRMAPKLSSWTSKSKGFNLKGRAVNVYTRHTFTRYSVRIEVLQRIAKGIPGMPPLTPDTKEIINLLAERAALQKDLTTYFPALAYCEESGRLRFDMKTFGIDTARFSGGADKSAKRVPWALNVVTLPKRERVKRCVSEPEGFCVVQLDARSEEPCLLANYSRDPELIALFTTGDSDYHKRSASLVYNKPVEQVTAAERKAVKPIGLGALYNLGVAALSTQYETSHAKPKEHAARVLDSLKSGNSGAAKWAAAARLRALITGVSTTPWGRQVPTRKWSKPRRGGVEEVDAYLDGPNATIQSGGSDVLRILLDAAWKWIDLYSPESAVVSCVHDSLQLRFKCDDLSKLAQLVDYLEAAALEPWMLAPLRVDVQVGWNLGNMYEPKKSWSRSITGFMHATERVEENSVVCDYFRERLVDTPTIQV